MSKAVRRARRPRRELAWRQVTSSITALIVVVLVCLIGRPALAVAMLDRRSR